MRVKFKGVVNSRACKIHVNTVFTYTAKDMTELWNFSSFFLWWYFLQKHVNKNAIWCIFFHISKKYKDLEFFRKIGCFIWRAANQLKILGSYLIKSKKYFFQSIWKKYSNNFLSNLLLLLLSGDNKIIYNLFIDNNNYCHKNEAVNFMPHFCWFFKTFG